MVAFLFMNFIVGITAFLFNYRVLKVSDFVDSILSLFILYLAQVVTTQILLGIMGILNLTNIILLNLAIFLIIWFITRNKEYQFNIGTHFKDTLTQILSNKIILLVVSLILGFGLVKFFINLINPPFGWDDLNYHFTFPVEWLKQGNLNNPITVFDEPGPTYYPINGSLLFSWLILPLRNVFLADVGQVPFFILVFLATYSLSKKVGLNKEFSFYAAGLFMLIPNFFKQLEIAYVDVMVAALFLVCLNYLFLVNKEFSWKNILVYSMSLGLLLGTKTIAFLYSLMLFLPFLYYCIRNCKPISFLKSKKKLYLFIISIFVIVVLGGFTYIRNYFEAGNPFYPLNFRLLGKIIFKGVMDASVFRSHFKIEDYGLAKLLFHEGLGAQATVFILPSLFLALPATFIRNKKLINFNLVYFLILPFLLYLAYRYIIPLANARYLYPFLGIGMIIGFYTFALLGIPKRILNILVIICSLSSISELAKRQELIASIILASLCFFLLPGFIKYLKIVKQINKTLLIIFSLFFIIWSLIILEKDYIKNEYARYIKMQDYSGFWPDATSAWDWLNRNTSKDNIAYAGRPVPFPLYGTGFKNNVYYVSVNKTEPVKLHYFPKSHYQWGYDFLSLHKNLEAEGNYRSNADYSSWLDNLKKRNIDYLFVYSLHQTKNVEFPSEDKWAMSYPAKFTLVFKKETVHIYKISKGISYTGLKSK